MAKIKFFRRIACIVLCAIFALIYVHQEVEIVKTGLYINDNHRQLAFLLDQYRSLVYNLSELESPRRIEDNLNMKEIALFVPGKGCIRRFNGMN